MAEEHLNIIEAASRIPPGQVISLRCWAGCGKGWITKILALTVRIQWFEKRVVAFTIVMGQVSLMHSPLHIWWSWGRLMCLWRSRSCLSGFKIHYGGCFWDIINHHHKSLRFNVFYNVWRFQNEYGCSIWIALCLPPGYLYVIMALAAEVLWVRSKDVAGSLPMESKSVSTPGP